MAWNALLNAKDFNPQSIHTAAPVNLLNGSIKASGFAKPNQQIIQLEKIDLKGRLAQAGQEMVALAGKVQQLYYLMMLKQAAVLKALRSIMTDL